MLSFPDSSANAKSRLLQLLKLWAFQEKEVTLSSGRVSNFYVDCKQVTLDAEGHVLVGRLLFEAIKDYENSQGTKVLAVGGLTLGADPIASAVSLTSSLLEHPIPAFIVRKEAKGHGTQDWIEGLNRVPQGSELIVVEDTVTTGASAQKAAERVRAAGFTVKMVLAIVDRLEGGREALEQEGLSLISLFTREDFFTANS